eukprot:46145_1
MANSSTQLPSCLADCNEENLVFLLNTSVVDDKIEPYKNGIIAYIESNKINGRKLLSFGRQKFAENVFEHSQNRKINMAAHKTYDEFIKFNFSEPSRIKSTSPPSKINLWHKQYTSTLPTSNDAIISLTLNTIEIALRLNLGETPSSSLIDDILLSPLGSSKSTHSDIEPSHILSNINRYKSSFESLNFIQNNRQKLDQVLTTLNQYISEIKEAVSCILRDKNKLNMILLYKKYKSNEYILYEPRDRLQFKLNSPHFLLFKTDKLLTVFLEHIFCADHVSNEYMADFIRYKSSNFVEKAIDFYLLSKDLKNIGVELKSEKMSKEESKEETIAKAENWLFNKLKRTQFKDMDADENLVLDREEFHAFFQFYGMNEKFIPICDAIFDSIDANNDGTVSLIEWFKWQNTFNRKDLHKLFVSKLTENEVFNESHPSLKKK